MSELERLLSAALAEEAEQYDVSPGAASALRRSMASTPGRPAVPSTRPGARARRVRVVGALAAAAAVVTALVVVPLGRGSHTGAPATLGVATSAPATGAGTASGPQVGASLVPGSVRDGGSVALGFTADRITLAGRNVWAFGMDAAGVSHVAHLVDRRVVRSALLPAPVCSASVRDTASGIAVVLGSDPACTHRDTLRLLDPESLALEAPATAAVGGDALMRPTGSYAVDAGVLSRLDAGTLAPTGQTLTLGAPDTLVNLASVPGDDTAFATVYTPARHTTRLVTFRLSTLRQVSSVALNAPVGALPYATAGESVWITLDTRTESLAVLRTPDGRQGAAAFGSSDLATDYAESGFRLWALTPGGQLSCASLTTGRLQGQTSGLAGTGALAADGDYVYVGNTATRTLDFYVPDGDCTADGRAGH